MNITVKFTRDENKKYYSADEVTLDIEDYLKGVVPSEIGNAHIEACKAQAIAARAYAYNYVKKNSPISDASSSAQAFRSSRLISKDYPNAHQAVEETHGMLLAYNGTIINSCPFSASNGGKTVSSKERWGGERAWLISKDDPWDIASGVKTKQGHSVGMSQRGAKYAASIGKTYKDILAFYYDGTEIVDNYGVSDGGETVMVTENEKVTKLREWILSKVGCGYVWGATGQTLTASLLESMAAANSNVKADVCKKWIGKQVFDCATFVRRGLESVGISICSGASSQWFEKTGKTYWTLKGTVDNMPSNRLLIMYRAKNSTVMQHTGFNLGNGVQVDDRGSSSGVIKTNYGTYAWTHWAIPAGLYTDSELDEIESELGVVKDEFNTEVLYNAKVINVRGYLNFRATNSTSGKDIGDIPISTSIPVYSVDSSTGMTKTYWNGSYGYVMNKYLERIEEIDSSTEDVPDDRVYEFIVKCSSEEERTKLMAQYDSSMVELLEG